jgi:dipeptidyl aminopeptidase/acylaminoacyl peptidase
MDVCHIPAFARAASKFVSIVGLGLAASAQGTVINDPLPAGIVGDVESYAVTPDAQRAVYAADQDVDGTVGLYSVPLGGGAAVVLDPAIELSGSEPDFGQSFRITPDARTVVYVDRTLGSLFSVPVAGGAPPTLLSGSSWVERYELSADSEHVVFVAGATWQGPFELLAVPVAGGDPVSLSGPLPASADVGAFRLTPDGRRVAYVVDQDTDDAYELYGAVLDGSARVELNVPLAPREDVLDFQLAPDSKSVVYRTEAGAAERILVTSLAGGPSLELATGALESFQLTPDGRTVVLQRDGALFRVDSSGGPVIPPSAG